MAEVIQNARPVVSAKAGRILGLDIARVLALAAMVVFHFVRDLELFGLVSPGLTRSGAWAVSARLIAGSFIALSGISVILVHAQGFRPGRWLRQVLTVAAAAALISAATYVAFPDRFVYFGILHAIALFGLLAPLGLRLAPWGLVILAAAIYALHAAFGRALFAAPELAWTGLSRSVPPALDLIPVVPWLAFFLLGMAGARAIPPERVDRMRSAREVPVVSFLARHSLAVYLLHQPVLLVGLWCATAVLS